MKFIANRADRWNKDLRKLNLPGIMEEFDRSIHKEIDYNNEFMNMQRIEANFEDNPYIHIHTRSIQLRTSISIICNTLSVTCGELNLTY